MVQKLQLNTSIPKISNLIYSYNLNPSPPRGIFSFIRIYHSKKNPYLPRLTRIVKFIIFTKNNIMLLYTRSHLYETTYVWNSPEIQNARIKGFPDHLYFNTHEGYELLHFINRYMDTKNYTCVDIFNRLERMIKDNILPNQHSHLFVKNWLDKYFHS